jgi:LPXTG-motif cell wall-anchored protein
MRVGSERIASVTIDTLISGRRQRLKKLMLVAAALAMMLITAAPAVAQVGQESEQEGESGEVDQSFTVSGSGGSANQCAALLGGAQSGNSQNQTDLHQDSSTTDDLEFEESGSNITLSPEQAEECEQIINQAAASATAPKAAAASAPKVESKSATSKAEAAKAEAKKTEAKADSTQAKKAELPKTGGMGTASLFALGTGGLLVAGGLLARRIFR